jgi:acyl-coenzyme A thioesterase PaaI-like protein
MSFNTKLGLRVSGSHEVTLDAGPEHEVVPGLVHFAVLTTLAEVAAASALPAPGVPSSVHVSLLARAHSGCLVGTGRLLRSGRRLAVAEGEVTQEGRLVAKATITFALMS